MARVYNFSAGPAVLPIEVLKEAQDPATYPPLTYQGLYPGASSPVQPRARPTPYPLPNIQADRDQGGLPLPAGLGLLAPTAMCLGPGQDPQ